MQQDREFLTAALIGARAMVERIERQLGVARPGSKAKHKISPEGKARIAAAQRSRWAAQKAGVKKTMAAS